MKFILITLLIIFNFNFVLSQEYKKIEDKAVVEILDLIFRYSESKNIRGFNTIMTNDFYCILCGEIVSYERPYIHSKEDFIKRYLTELLNIDLFSRAYYSNEVKTEMSDDVYRRSDIIISFTIYNFIEIGIGPEGGSLGIYLKKEDGKLKFSGLETIP